MNLAVMHDSHTKRTTIRSALTGVRTRDGLGAGLKNGRHGTMPSMNERRMGLAAAGVVRAVVTLGMLMVSTAAAVAQPVDIQAVRSAAAAVNAAVVPYAVGEELTYKASLGGISAGTARRRPRPSRCREGAARR